MRTAPAYLRRGAAGPAFGAAHVLYARSGFEPCGPFADYTGDPFSRFFRLGLTDRAG